MSDSVTFVASIASLQSAITIAAEGGARVKIDVPESEMDALVSLLRWREMALEITVRPKG